MKKKITFPRMWKVLKESIKSFSQYKITKLSASLAYYTIFSLGPLMIVILFLAGIFFGRDAVEGSVFTQMRSFVGADAALQIQEIIKNVSIGGKSHFAAIVGVVTLLIGTTTMFAEMQDSINTIWGLKASPKAGFVKLLKDRLLSFGVVASLGFLLLVSLGVSAIIESLNQKISLMFPGIAVSLLYVVNILVTFGIITTLFMIIFKVLPDANIKWKDVLSGAIATAILFMIGKFAISFYISKSNVGSTYGTAGSLIILIVWIYFSAIILYFGAAFTRAYAMEFGGSIHPNEYAIISKTVEVEAGKKSLQNGDKEVEQKVKKLNEDSEK